MARVVYVTGCRWEFLAWLENNFDVVGATALAFAILHVRSVHLLYCIYLYVLYTCST